MKYNLHTFLLAAVLPVISSTASAETSTSTVEVQAADQAAHKENQKPVARSRDKNAAPVSRASEIIGTNVKNTQGETIGEIEDLLVNLRSGKIMGVVISSGGFLGIADTLSTVPTSSLKYDTNADTLSTPLTKEQLGKAPQFKSDSWPTNRKEVMKQLRTFRDSIGGDVSKPDNTAQNEKDMRQEKLTPLDQSENKPDLKITQEIRSAIMHQDLSFNAKNVKIITDGGKVTLRGVVDSAKEKEAVVRIAKKWAGEADVTDQIKVKQD